MKLDFIGPPALDRIDHVEAVIRESRISPGSIEIFDPNDPRNGEPYLFSANEDLWPGRTHYRTEPISMTLGDREYIMMFPQWKEVSGDLPSRPIRLALVCKVEGYDAWVLPAVVQVPRQPKISKAQLTRGPRGQSHP